MGIEHKKVTTSMAEEDFNFFKDENISPADVLRQHAQNLRGMLGIKYSEVIRQKDLKISALSALISRVCDKLSQLMPEDQFKDFMRLLQ